MLARMAQLNVCRGRSTQCDERDRLFGELKAAGMCWGLPGQAEYQKEWHVPAMNANETGGLILILPK
jgi:hypothetical protein